VDSHNDGVNPSKIILKYFIFIYTYFQREADLTVVTNLGLARIVQQNGGNSFVLPDKVPHLQRSKNIQLKGEYNFTYICSFEDDEPYREIIQAAKINTNLFFYITGDYKKCPPALLQQAGENIVFTGFLSDRDYCNLLFSSDFIIDLTDYENCLVCGAYEAVAAEVPLILSDTKALRTYFSKGVVFTKNNVNDIAEKVNSAIERKEVMEKEIQQLKKELMNSWNRIGHQFKGLISIMDE
jgi:glycosyltransferase involved in cell wall biosynthesis